MADPETERSEPESSNTNSDDTRVLEDVDRFIDRHLAGEDVDMDIFCADAPADLMPHLSSLS